MRSKELSYSDSAAYVASQIAKAAPGSIFRISGYNSGAAQFVQLLDAATLLADTAVPKIVFAVAATSNFDFDFGEKGRFCEAGIVVCNSSTGPTKTIGGADCWFNIEYS